MVAVFLVAGGATRCWDEAWAGPLDGGPDYSLMVTPEVEAVTLPPLVEVGGEWVVATFDLPALVGVSMCEWNTDDWHVPTTGNGYWGHGQWLLATWHSTWAGGEWARPDLAPVWAQLDAMREVVTRDGDSFREWPGCARKLGLPRG